MPLANAVKCWECKGDRGECGYLPVKGHIWVNCARCHGAGQLCADCHQPEGICECVPPEPCDVREDGV